MRHAQRPEDVFGDILLERLPGNALDDIARQCSTIIGICWCLTRRIYARGHILDQILSQRPEIGSRPARMIGECRLETRGVRHQMTQSDCLRISSRNLKVEVLINVAVEVELALLDQLHHGSPGKEL